MVLTRRSVDGIQLQGGTILGTSRGGADIRCGTQAAADHLHRLCLSHYLSRQLMPSPLAACAGRS